jgi:hypothetical protein
MTRRLVRAGDRFADSIGGHEQPLFVLSARGEELEVLRVQVATKRSGVWEQRRKPLSSLMSRCL